MVGYRRFYHPLHSQIQTFSCRSVNAGVIQLELQQQFMMKLIRSLFRLNRTLLELWVGGKGVVKFKSKTFHVGNLALSTLDSDPPFAWFGTADFSLWNNADLQLCYTTEHSSLDTDSLSYLSLIHI